MTEVWLAEESNGRERWAHDILGVFSTQEKAEKVCQDRANEYFGERNTPTLIWRRYPTVPGYSSAGYDNPAGTFLFQVTSWTVDKVEET